MTAETKNMTSGCSESATGQPGSAPPRSPGRAAIRNLLHGLARSIREHRRAGGFRGQVERAIDQRLGRDLVGARDIARTLGCSRQTLYRRLKAEGHTFEDVLDRLRREQALRLLRNSRLTIQSIGYRLGYSDPAAFSRAFKRWTGVSPRTHRQGHNGNGSATGPYPIARAHRI
jgi:AraC-like DNA-binding protein